MVAKLAGTFARSACRRGRDGGFGIEADLPLGLGKHLPALIRALSQTLHLRHDVVRFAHRRAVQHLAHQPIMAG